MGIVDDVAGLAGETAAEDDQRLIAGRVRYPGAF
jgi:hypothetical protein